MKVTWLGHAAFLFDFSGVMVVIDPYISENPACPVKLDEIEHVDVVLVTHDHFDHLGDAVKIAKKFEAVTAGVPEFVNWLSSQGVKAIPGNIGGELDLGKGVKVRLAPAFHTCSRGVPVGFVVSRGDEVVYHAGDTSHTAYMRTIGEMYDLKLACLPIGGTYTMDAEEAILAVKDLRPKYVIPMHYNTWEAVRADPEEFARKVREETSSQPVVLSPGESVEL